MATLYEQLQQQVQHENMRKLQQLLSITEGTSGFSNPYLARGGTTNQLWTSYANHPYFINPNEAKWKFKWNNGKEDYATAHGKYMIRQNTWQGASKGLGRQLTFRPEDQDIAMAYLVNQRGALNDVLQGNWQSAFRKLGPEWASLPTSPYAQHKFSNKGFIAALQKVGIDPRQAGYNGNFKVNPNPLAQNPATQTMNNLAGNTANVPMGVGNWDGATATRQPSQTPDLFTIQQPNRASSGLAQLTGQTRVLGVDYLDKYFAALAKQQQKATTSAF